MTEEQTRRMIDALESIAKSLNAKFVGSFANSVCDKLDGLNEFFDELNCFVDAALTEDSELKIAEQKIRL